MRFVLITSYVRLHAIDEQPADAVSIELNGSRMGISLKPSEHGKCVRCWHHREDVGADPAHPELCGRCVNNVEGEGERRLYA